MKLWHLLIQISFTVQLLDKKPKTAMPNDTKVPFKLSRIVEGIDLFKCEWALSLAKSRKTHSQKLVFQLHFFFIFGDTHTRNQTTLDYQ